MNIIEKQIYASTGEIKAKSLAEVVDNLGEDKVLEIVNNYMHRREYTRVMHEVYEAMQETLKNVFKD